MIHIYYSAAELSALVAAELAALSAAGVLVPEVTASTSAKNSSVNSGFSDFSFTKSLIPCLLYTSRCV